MPSFDCSCPGAGRQGSKLGPSATRATRLAATLLLPLRPDRLPTVGRMAQSRAL